MLLLHPAALVEAPLGRSTVLSATARPCAHEARWSSCAGGPGGEGGAGVSETDGVLWVFLSWISLPYESRGEQSKGYVRS